MVVQWQVIWTRRNCPTSPTLTSAQSDSAVHLLASCLLGCGCGIEMVSRRHLAGFNIFFGEKD